MNRKKNPAKVGEVFGRLTVISIGGMVKNVRFIRCKCQCGTLKIVRQGDLREGYTKSCGCLQREVRAATATTHGACKGHQTIPEYQAWAGMKERCHNPNLRSWKYYGAKGVKICQRWLGSFSNFLEDMGTKPTPGHSLDRWPKRNGNYEPGNCRWATDEQQNNNKADNRIITIKGESKTIAQWSRATGIKFITIWARLERGWTGEKIISPVIPVVRKAKSLV